MEPCSLSLTKYLLFIFNSIFAISGLGLVAVGAVVFAAVDEYRYHLEGRILAPPIVLIITGIIIFVVAFLGCYGAIKESYYKLMAFALCLLIIFIIQFAVGIAAAVYRNNFDMILRDAMKSSLLDYHDVKSDRLAWDNLQTKMECCGVDGPNDWPAKQMPRTCCHKVRRNADLPELPEEFYCNSAQPSVEILYSTGCFEKLKMKAHSNATILISVGLGIAFIELVGIIFACLLASAIEKKQ